MPDDPEFGTRSSSSADEEETTPLTTGEGAELPPTSFPRIPGYEVRRLIGEGGMGTVYEAEQQQPHRRVALKVIRSGAHVTEHQIRLFQREIESLARLNHPSIAAIYDAGRTSFGQHFFTMELLQGTPLATHSASIAPPRTRSELRDRLLLFLEICDAIQYAHQRGVIHRDLKPSNLIVADSEPSSSGSASNRPRVKVLDFGLARITDADVSLTSTDADMGKIQGTLAYMSPEQARGDVHAVDTRADVYALGVILYELMTGTRPYDVRKRYIHEAVRVIEQEEPRRPSSTATILRGDLETIVLKALEKDPEARYGTVAAMAEDIRRHLRDEPIVARPPSTFYQIGKFAKRNRALVAGVLVVLGTLLAGLIVSMSQYLRAEGQRALAEVARDESDAVTEFLVGMIAEADPWETAKSMTIREAVTKAAKTVDERFVDQPSTRARLQRAFGKMNEGLGDYQEAERHSRNAYETYRSLLGDEDPKTLESKMQLAGTYWFQNRRDDALPLLMEGYATARRVLGDDDPLTVNYMHWFGNFQGIRLNEIEEFLRDDIEHFMLTTVEAYERVYGPDCMESTGTLSNLATRYAAEKRYAEADSLRLAMLKIQRRELGDGDPQTAFTMRQLGMGYKKQGRFQEALPLLEEALEVYKEALGETHPYTWRTMGYLASLHRVEGRYREAESLRLESLEILRRTMGEMHRATLAVRRALTILQMAQGRYAEAESFYRQVLPVVKPTFLGAETRWGDIATVGNALVHWGGCLRKLEDHLEADRAFGEADSLLSEAYQRFASSHGSEDSGVYEFVAQVVRSGLGHSVEPEYELTCPCGTCAEFYETWIQAREAETSRSELSVSDVSDGPGRSE